MFSGVDGLFTTNPLCQPHPTVWNLLIVQSSAHVAFKFTNLSNTSITYNIYKV